MINEYQNNVGLKYYWNNFSSQEKEPIENQNIEIDSAEQIIEVAQQIGVKNNQVNIVCDDMGSE